MKRIQLIFCVETNQKADTDFKYIMSTVARFYKYKTGNIHIVPEYLGGKGRYSTDKTEKKIAQLIKKFNGGSGIGESYVLLCLDCDRYDSDPKDHQFLLEAEKYCENHSNYRLIWFCRDVEDVFLGRQISDKEKKMEAERFLAKKQIEKTNINCLMANQFKPHHSNLCLVLDQFLSPK